MTTKKVGGLHADPVVLREKPFFLGIEEQIAKLKAQRLEAMRVRAELKLPPDPLNDVTTETPVSTPGPTQGEVTDWIVDYYSKAHKAHMPPPKRDLEVFPACREAIGATERQMKEGVRKVPGEFKRQRGQRDR
jgi:hypothetical protein